MFAFVKKLLGKKTEPSPVESKAAAPASVTPDKSAPAAAVSAPVQGATSRLTRAEVSARTPAPPPPMAPVDPNASLKLSLLGIVDLLPKELKPSKAVGDIASVQLAVPLSLVAGQLSSGCVRISFGELKQLAPQGFFTVSGSDEKLIDLPLQEILPQVTSSLFTRREGQQAVYVPEDVTNVFSARGGTVAPTNKPSAFSATVPASQPQATAPAASKAAPIPTNPVAQSSSPGRPNPASGSTTMYFKRPGAGATPAAKSAEPAKAAGSSVGNSAPAAAKPATPSPSAPVKPAAAATPAPAAEPTPPVSKPIAAPNLLAALKPGTPVAPAPAAAKPKAAAPIPGPAPIPVSARPAPSAPGKPGPAPAAAPTVSAPSAAAADDRTVNIPLSRVSGTWPEAIQAEIAAWQIGAASLVLPVSQVEAALRQGRVSYSWSVVLEHLEQGAGEGKQSPAGDTVLEFPLSVVAPAFLSARQAGPAKTSTAIDATIPDLFQAAKSAEPAPAAPAAPAPAAAPAKPTPKAAAPAAAKPAHGLSMKSAPAPAPAAPAAVPVAPAADPHAGEFLSIPVAMVDDSWLEPIKAELAKTKIPGLKLQIPYEEVNRGLKAGKLEYPWKQIRAWIQPALASTLAGDHSEKPVTLPLKVVAPMFLGHFKPGKGGKKADIAQDIPDLFSGGSSAPAEIATTVAGPAASPAPASAAAADSTGTAEPAAASGSGSYSTTQFFRKPPTDIGELFGQPGKRHWSPQEIVQGTARIRGVAGAVIAMQDGLLVAAHLQSPWRPEATAAFLPQIYSRLNQYLHELSVGDLRSVALDTPSGKLLVFSTGIIYFAVVTKPDESVPIAAIELIVGELGRHSK